MRRQEAEQGQGRRYMYPVPVMAPVPIARRATGRAAPLHPLPDDVADERPSAVPDGVGPGLAHFRLPRATATTCSSTTSCGWTTPAVTTSTSSTRMRDRGVEVVELHDLLTETIFILEAEAWLMDAKSPSTRSLETFK